MNVQHINIKIFATKSEIDLGDAIPVFHRWIQDSVLDELLVDVADYRPVPEGPGVILVGDEAMYGLDSAHKRFGLLYNRRRAMEGSTQDKLLKCFASALNAVSLLEQETVFTSKLQFNAGSLEVIFNDRALVPNTPESWDALLPELTRFFDGFFGAENYRLEHVGEPRERLRVSVTSKSPVLVGTLLNSLQPA